MTRWEYKYAQTYWVESGRQENYNTWISYTHRWTPAAIEEDFPSEAGFAAFGADGWELAGTLEGTSSQVTFIGKQQSDSYTSFRVYTLIFKRPAA